MEILTGRLREMLKTVSLAPEIENLLISPKVTLIMRYHQIRASVAVLFGVILGSEAFIQLPKRQLPAAATNVTTITSPAGVKIRYKEPGKEGVCETTPGVNS